MILNFLFNIFFYLSIGLVAVFIAIYLFFRKKYKYWEERNVRYVKPSFPMGNLNPKESMAVVFRKLYEKTKHERYYGIFQLFKPMLMINDPDLIKQILIGDFMSFHDHGTYSNEKQDPLSANLFALEGTAWRNLRVKLSPTFTTGKMKLMFPIVAAFGKEMQEVVKDSAKIGDVIELKDLTARYSTDVISSSAFGIAANSLKDPDSIIRRMGRKLFEPNWLGLIRFTLAFVVPDLARFLNTRFTDKEVADFFLNAFRDTMSQREKSNIERNDVMQLLIQLKNKGFIDDVDSKKNPDDLKKGDKFTVEQAAAQAFIYFIGGFETSSSTMQFAFYELALNQDIQTKAREEIKRVLAKHNGELTYEAMNEMEYLGRVVDETLRKHFPGIGLLRECTKTFKVPDSDLVIEKGTLITIPVVGIHRDERYYPDPEKFDPERFTEEQKASRHNYVYLPFGDGPRVCIGQRFGLMQTKVGLISLLSKYKFDVAPGRTSIPIEYDPKTILPFPKGGVNLKISLVEE